MKIKRLYTLKYVCSNCYRERYFEFEKGKPVPYNYKSKVEECEKCGCKDFLKSSFQ